MSIPKKDIVQSVVMKGHSVKLVFSTDLAPNLPDPNHHPKALPVVINGVNYGQDHVYAGSFLDRSWVELDQYEEDIGSISDTDDTLLSLLCATQTDFGDRGSKFMTTEF